MTKSDFKHKVFSLSERLYPMVVRMLGSSAKAEDAIQDIMMKLWLKRKKIDNHPNLTGLVFLTARNHCIDLLRKKDPLVENSTSHLKIVVGTYESKQLEWQQLNIIIKDILEKLPEQQSEVFIMRDIDGYEFNEIASALELKIEHVRVLVSRARKHISLELEKSYDYERGQY